MRVWVTQIVRERLSACRDSLVLTVEVDGELFELDGFTQALWQGGTMELEPLRVKQRGPRAHLGDRVVYDEHHAEIIADCTTQEAAEAALRLLG